MRVTLKPLREQTVVITGASGGIGLATARLATRRGAQLVLAARSENDVRRLVAEIERDGGRAMAVAADVGDDADVTRIRDEAVRTFGGFDTWVNIAAASMYGEALEVSLADVRRVFDTNVWGVIHGSRVACEYLRAHGGALINVGGEVSDVAVPLWGVSSASKHAVKGWTDALRLELEVERAPVSVTLITPGPIDTPYTQPAKNYRRDQPKHALPVYAPALVAEAILQAAEHPVRELFVGGGATRVATRETVSSRLTGKLLRTVIVPATHSGRSRRCREARHRAGPGLRERGNYEGGVRKSMSTKIARHRLMTGVVAVGAAVALASLLRGRGVAASP